MKQPTNRRTPKKADRTMSGQNDIARITQLLLKFRQERNWKRFHKPKDMALSLVLEAAELLEHFQWKTDAQAKAHIAKNKEAVADELADVFNWVVLLSHDLGVDLARASEGKIEKNRKKYPVTKAGIKF